MSIEIQPYQSPNPAYRPIQWQLKQTYADVVERCVPTITVNGTAYTMPPVPFDAAISSGNDYYFYVDAQSFVQAALAPKSTVKSSIFDGFNAPLIQLNADLFADIELSVTYLYRDPTTNLLVDLGVTDTDSGVYAIPCTPQHSENLDFDDYKPLFNDTTKKWLSIMPNPNSVTLTDNAFLTFLSDAGAAQIRIRSYTAAGVMIDEGYFAADTSMIYEVQTVAVGPANLATQIYTTGAVDLTDPTTAYYTVELVGAAVPFLSPYLEIKRFNLADNCGATTRLHWFGILAGAESYTFTIGKVKRLQVQNQFASTPPVIVNPAMPNCKTAGLTTLLIVILTLN